MQIPYKKILVPLDGSELAAQALPHAEVVARASGAKLILSQIVETEVEFMVAPVGTGASGSSIGVGAGSMGVVVGDDPGEQQVLDEAQAHLEQLAASLRHQKIDVAVDVNTGDPASSIIDFAADNDVDLIVMSTHGRTGIGRWTHGSVTSKVLQAAPCAVLVVRPTAVQ